MKGVNLRIMKCFLNLERKTKRIYKEGLVVIGGRGRRKNNLVEGVRGLRSES